jgi:hypothetical protein
MFDLVTSMHVFDAGTIAGAPLTADPLLGPLADNGGPTRTMALLPGSPALDAGSAFGLSTDQRGQPRPHDCATLANAGDGSDVGAFELQPPAVGDTTAPVVEGPVRATPPRFAVDPKGGAEVAVASGSKPRRPKRGTRFGYRLSEPARVVFTVERKAKGRRVGKACRKQTAANRRRKPCARYLRVAAFAQQAAAGAVTKPFSGRIGSRRLAPGAHRATLVATDAAGNASGPARVAFTVVAPGVGR